MTDFQWGNRPFSFPSDYNRVKDEMKDYISEEDIGFVSNLRIAITIIKQKGENPDALIDEFKKMYNEILEEELLPLINRHDDGMQAIKNFTTTKVGNKPIKNEKNEKFLSELKIQSIKDSKSLDRLRGFGGLEFGKKPEDMPNFDAEDVLDSYLDKQDYLDNMAVDFEFREVLPDNMDEYDSLMQPVRYGYGSENVVFVLPIKEETIIELKQEHIVEVTNQQPDFFPKKSKDYYGPIYMDISIDIPDSVVEEMTSDKELTIQPVKALTNKNDKPTGKYENVGSPYQLENSDFQRLGLAGMDNRSDSMINEGVFDLEGKGLVKVIILDSKGKEMGRGRTDGAGKNIKVPNSTINELKEKIYTIVKTLETKMYKPKLENPHVAHTYKAVFSFKTDVVDYNSLTTKVGKVIDGKEKNIESISILQDGKYKQLSVEEAQKLESEAWTHKETKQKISNAEYIGKEPSERNEYSANYNIINQDGVELNPLNETATTRKNITGYRLKDAPEDAYAEKTTDKEIYIPISEYRSGKGKGTDKELSLEEGERLKEELESKRSKEENTKLLPFDKRYKKSNVSSYDGEYIDRKEYEKLKALKGDEDEFRFTRKVKISLKAFLKLNRDESDYEPIYGKDIKLTQKEIDASKLRAKRRANTSSESPPSIESPAKYGKNVFRGMAVVSGEDVHLNALTTYQNVQKAFKNLKLRIELEFRNFGNFKLTPARRRKNDEMSNVIEDIRENLIVLEEKLGV